MMAAHLDAGVLNGVSADDLTSPMSPADRSRSARPVRAGSTRRLRDARGDADRQVRPTAQQVVAGGLRVPTRQRRPCRPGAAGTVAERRPVHQSVRHSGIGRLEGSARRVQSRRHLQQPKGTSGGPHPGDSRCRCDERRRGGSGAHSHCLDPERGPQPAPRSADRACDAASANRHRFLHRSGLGAVACRAIRRLARSLAGGRRLVRERHLWSGSRPALVGSRVAGDDAGRAWPGAGRAAAHQDARRHRQARAAGRPRRARQGWGDQRQAGGPRSPHQRRSGGAGGGRSRIGVAQGTRTSSRR